METATIARPDLSALHRDVRVRITLAERVYGATWKRGTYDDSSIRYAELHRYGTALVRLRLDRSGNVEWAPHILALPAYLTDPGAWGALLEKELCGVHQGLPNGPWKGQWCNDMDARPAAATLSVGPICRLLPEAVCAAVLAKHGIDWMTLEPVG